MWFVIMQYIIVDLYIYMININLDIKYHS